MSDRYSEIIYSLKKHKTRNVLTGFGVAWGIFILMLLLGTGQGLQDGIFRLFSSFVKNSIWVYGGQISEDAGNNYQVGTPVVFDESLLTDVKQRFKEVDLITPEIHHHQNSIITFKNKNQIGSLKGVGTEYFDIKLLKLSKGRAINKKDVESQRPVCVIGHNINKVLSKNNSLIGKWINISGTLFKVIGVLEKGSVFEQGEQNSIYVSINSFQTYFNNENTYSIFGILLKPNSSSTIFEKELKSFLGKRLKFDKTDNKALFISNVNEQVSSFKKLFSGIKLFLWFVGISILLSGIIGIGNIMLVIVKERTYEIGIRKALGARSRSILFMILSESVAITLLAGLIGLLLGVAVITLANYVLKISYDTNELLISSLNINYSAVITAVVLLVISGALAGLFPAKKASEISPVKALNQK